MIFLLYNSPGIWLRISSVFYLIQQGGIYAYKKLVYKFCLHVYTK